MSSSLFSIDSIMKSQDSNYYDQQYYNKRHTQIDPYLESVFSRYVLPSDTAGLCLDVGCGSGVYVDFMRSRGYKAWGIDFSVDAAKLSGQINASALHLPFPDNTFDLVLSVHMIEHLNSEEAGTFFSECFRVLKNKGRLFIMTPNGICPGRLILKDKWFPDPSHINIYDPLRLKKQLKLQQFSRIKSMFFLPLNRIHRDNADIVKYYGLDFIFKQLPILQDLIFFLIFSTPLAFLRDVIYMRAEVRK